MGIRRTRAVLGDSRRDHVDDTAFSVDNAVQQRASSPHTGVTVQVNKARTIAL